MKDHLEQKEVVKVVITGSQESGKTQLRNSFIREAFIFSEDYKATLGIDFSTIDRPEKKLRIWEISGNPKLAQIGNSHYRGTDLVVLCVDLSKEIDREELIKSIARVREYEENCAIILAGTKNDKARKKNIRIFNRLDLQDNKIVKKIATSAKTGENIDPLLNLLFKKMVANPDQEISAWDRAFDQLQKGLADLSESKKIFVQSAVISLVSVIQKRHLSPDVKLDLITRTLISVHKKIDEIEHPVLKALAVIVAIAVVTVIAGLIGYGFGLWLGAWTGPGIFFTALAAGTIAAASVAAVSIAIGLGAGGGVAYGFFKKPDNAVEQSALTAYSDNLVELVNEPIMEI